MKALLAPHTCLRLTNATLVDAVQCVTMITAYSTELPGAFLLKLTGIGKVPLWRNWQTRQTQNLFPATEWEFESPWGHHYRCITCCYIDNFSCNKGLYPQIYPRNLGQAYLALEEVEK